MTKQADYFTRLADALLEYLKDPNAKPTAECVEISEDELAEGEM